MVQLFKRRGTTLPLFPLHTVLFPGGRLSLRIFEQRYVAMAKSRLDGAEPFGVCLITQGDEVAKPGGGPPDFARIGTLATISKWDMPQLGILHVGCDGGQRFQVRSHVVEEDGLVVAEVTPLAAEPAVTTSAAHEPLVRFLRMLADRIGEENFPAGRAYGDATWVGYRLAELLPLPPTIRQHMLEINDALVRLQALQQFLAQHALL
jgi:uncharacterized protein